MLCCADEVIARYFRFVNHQPGTSANCKWMENNGKWVLTVLKQLEPGQELFFDYGRCYWKAAAFHGSAARAAARAALGETASEAETAQSLLDRLGSAPWSNLTYDDSSGEQVRYVLDELGCSLLQSSSALMHNCKLGVLVVTDEPQQLQLLIPPGAQSGQAIQLEAAGGQLMQIVVPEGAEAGQHVTVSVQPEERAFSVLWMCDPVLPGELLSAELI